MKSQAYANDAYHYTRRHGGGTFDAATLRPDGHKVGYYVAHNGGLVVPEDAYTPEMLATFAATLPPGTLVGVWFDGGKVYLDHTEWLRRPWTARDIARAEQQLAIWDVERGISLYL